MANLSLTFADIIQPAGCGSSAGRRGVAASEAIVEARDIKKRLGGHEVLKGVSLTARRGDVIAIIGPSGSGKSTLLRCLNLLEIPDSGSLAFRGEQIFNGRHGGLPQRKQLDRFRAQVGMVFQRFNLWDHRTALENVTEGLCHVLGMARRAAKERAERCLAKVGLAGKENAYPAHLSGGQQQRVAIARALAMNPHVILFDEPTSALDPEIIGEVLQVIRQLASEGCTMMIATHEMAFAREVASHLIFLQDGAIHAEGAPKDLLSGNGPQRLIQFMNGGKSTDR
jgi:ABC-type histidine transport system ATPase subunit